MKKQLFIPALLLAGLTAITSCKKDNDDAINPSMQACKLERKITGADSTQLSYDSNDRVIKSKRFK